MTLPLRKLIFLAYLAASMFSSPVAWGQANESSINKELQALRPLAGPPTPGATPGQAPIAEGDRPAAILKTAQDIRSLPAGVGRVRLADGLLKIAMQGEAGKEPLQAAADALAQALADSPQPPGKDGLPAAPYMDLARVASIAHITPGLKDAQMAKADEAISADDAEIAKADFTLKDLNGRKYTLSALKGKIVLINFWATGCVTCRKEMQDLDLIYTHYEPQGLMVLSITGDNPYAVNTYLTGRNFHPPVLADDGKAAKQFHVDEKSAEGVPRTFVFDRDGKLVGESLDVCTQRQLFVMLGKAGLQPNR